MRPFVLSIAGFDPSSGAGITSDIKTFEAHGVYGLGVCSAITIQNDVEFNEVEWIDIQFILKQTDILLQRFKPEYCKIGLIKDFDTLAQLTDYLTHHNIKIVWDPILKASAGFVFHAVDKLNFSTEMLRRILSQLVLITPNLPEYERLNHILRAKNPEEWLSTGLQSLLVKGGHSDNDICTDILYQKGAKNKFENARIIAYDKHGTGCVLSSAIVARLALGENLSNACFLAKEYVNQFIKSNNSLLGEHTKTGTPNETKFYLS
jgi:hydroxymethylpyrimidine/phosphomethylpyrimidine kinase